MVRPFMRRCLILVRLWFRLLLLLLRGLPQGLPF